MRDRSSLSGPILMFGLGIQTLGVDVQQGDVEQVSALGDLTSEDRV